MTGLPEDTILVERLQRGDVEAFDLVYAKYSGRLYSFGYKYLKSQADAEELVQSVFFRLWEKHRTLKKEASFKSYLFTIAYNDICKIFRKRSYEKKYLEDASDGFGNSMVDIEGSIDYQSVLEQVYKIVDLLPDRQRAVFLKSRNEGKTTREIASELGLAPGTVDNYISDALKFIRKRMAGDSLPVILFISLFF